MLIPRVTVLLLTLATGVLPPLADASVTTTVRDFGATGDGATDDSGAIQRAIDAVRGGGVVFFPPGTYRVSRLRIGSRMALVGATAGAVTLRNDEPTGRNFAGIVTGEGVADGLSDVEIRNLTFERTVETDAFDEHVYLEKCRRVVIESSRFVGRITRADHAQKGVHLHGCRYARIVNNMFEDIGDNALALNGFDAATTDGHHVVSGNVFVRRTRGPSAQIVVTQSDVTVVANAFHGQAVHGQAGHWIETGSASGAAITALTLSGNSVRGFSSLIHDVSGVTAVGNALHAAVLNVDAVDARSRDVAFVGNVVTGGGFLRVKRADHVLIEGNLVTESMRDGIMIQEASSVSVLGNRVRRAQRSGVFVDGVAGSVVVVDNACDDNGQAGAADAAFGVLVQNVADATLAGNVCRDTQGAQATQRHGLAVNIARALTLHDNQATGNRVGAYREISPPGAVRRTGNSFDGARGELRRLDEPWSPPRLMPGAQTLVTLRMPGAQPGDLVVAGFSTDLRGLQLTGYVGTGNRVTLVLRNGTADPVALSPGRVKVQLLK